MKGIKFESWEINEQPKGIERKTLKLNVIYKNPLKIKIGPKISFKIEYFYKVNNLYVRSDHQCPSHSLTELYEIYDYF